MISLPRCVENIRISLQTLRSNKTKSLLTILGVIIGVVVVVLIASLLTGVRQNLRHLVQEYGTDNIYAFHLRTGFEGLPTREEWARDPLQIEDALAIRREATAVRDVAHQAISLEHLLGRTVRFRSESYGRTLVTGVSSNYGEVMNFSMAEGRFIDDSDVLRSANVCVLGSNVVDALFPNTSRVLGQLITLDGHPLKIIGVVDKRKNSFFGETDDDNSVYLPDRTIKRLDPKQKYLLLIVQANPGRLSLAMDETERILRTRRGLLFQEDNDFELSTADGMIDQFEAITSKISLLAIIISTVALFVGGIGVMSVMLVSVTERKREIGLRKAVGAKRQDIVLQFLFEAVTLTTLGGIIGIFLAIVSSHLLGFLLPAIPVTIQIWAIISGFTVSVSVGLVFGVWPALKAASLDPIENLHHE
jgi:putative ABC transport system permease protein